MFVGVDGCSAGWFGVTLEDDGWQIGVFTRISDLWARFRHAESILVDIPIGLRESQAEERLCDKAARQALGPPRASSVFPAPCRPAIYANSYEEASSINDRAVGRKLSRQSWAIAPKIREVDELLESDQSTRAAVREIHPEICFWALAGERAMEHAKKKLAGFAERKELLQAIFPETLALAKKASATYSKSRVAQDDILDALAAALTAKLGAKNGLSTLPAMPERDSKGLPMEMVYAVPSGA